MTDVVIFTGDEAVIVNPQDIFVICMERLKPDEMGDVSHCPISVDSIKMLKRKGSRLFTTHGDEPFFLCLLQESQ